jgi:hypothetical protein
MKQRTTFKMALPLLITTILLNISAAKAQPASTEWKHYTYPDLNLSFDLPADFTFEHPDESVGFIGANSLSKFSLLVVKEVIASREEKRNKMYTLSGMIYDPAFESEIMYGTTSNGYDMIFCVGETEDELGVVIMFLTDRKYSDLNFYINLTYGDDSSTDTPEYQQAQRILNSISPIEK